MLLPVSHTGLPSIKVAGVGGAGAYILNELSKTCLPLEYVCFDSSIDTLAAVSFAKAIHLGKNLSNGLGCGSNHELGRQLAEASRGEIAASVQDTDLLILVSGLGGGLGSGAIVVIADIARQLNIPTICFSTKPFSFEGKKRAIIALEAITQLELVTNGVLTVDHNKLIAAYSKNISFIDAINMGAKHLSMIIEQLVNIVQSNALINIDFADLLAIFNTHGKFSMGIASGSDDQDLASLVKQAVNHPLVEPLDNYTADGIVIYIEAGEDFDLDTLTKASDYAAHISHEKTEIIMGFNCSPGMQAIKVTILVAGIKPKAPPSTLISFAARKGV